MNLSEYLQEVMDQRGWSRAELARQLGFRQQYISRWMDGVCPTPLACQQIGAHLGIPYWTIMAMAGHPAAEELRQEGEPVYRHELAVRLALQEVEAIFAERSPAEIRMLMAVVRAVDATTGPTMEPSSGVAVHDGNDDEGETFDAPAERRGRRQGKYNSQDATYGQVLVAASDRPEGTQAYPGSAIPAGEALHRELVHAA